MTTRMPLSKAGRRASDDSNLAAWRSGNQKASGRPRRLSAVSALAYALFGCRRTTFDRYLARRESCHVDKRPIAVPRLAPCTAFQNPFSTSAWSSTARGRGPSTGRQQQQHPCSRRILRRRPNHAPYGPAGVMAHSPAKRCTISCSSRAVFEVACGSANDSTAAIITNDHRPQSRIAIIEQLVY